MNKNKWVATRNGEMCGVFENRKKAIQWMRGILKQSFDDLKNQDKNDEYDYGIDYPSYSIKEIEQRKEYLGL